MKFQLRRRNGRSGSQRALLRPWGNAPRFSRALSNDNIDESRFVELGPQGLAESDQNHVPFGPGRPCQYLGWCVLPENAQTAIDKGNGEALCQIAEQIASQQRAVGHERTAIFMIGASGIKVQEIGSHEGVSGKILLNATTKSVVSLVASSTPNTICVIAKTRGDHGQVMLGCDVFRFFGRVGARTLGFATGVRPVDGVIRDFHNLLRQRLSNFFYIDPTDHVNCSSVGHISNEFNSDTVNDTSREEIDSIRSSYS